MSKIYTVMEIPAFSWPFVNRLTMEHFSRRRWTSGSAQQSNNYGIMPCMWCKKIGFNINPTAFCLGRSSLHLLLLKSSMDQPSHQKNLTSYSKCKKVESEGFFLLKCTGRAIKCETRFGVGFHAIRRGPSVTRLGDLLDFGQLFKAFGNN